MATLHRALRPPHCTHPHRLPSENRRVKRTRLIADWVIADWVERRPRVPRGRSTVKPTLLQGQDVSRREIMPLRFYSPGAKHAPVFS